MTPASSEHRTPLRLAAVTTSWQHGGGPDSTSHAEVILKRWMVQHPGDPAWGWDGPSTSLVSVYVEQLHEGDEIHQLCREHEIQLASSVDEALTRGRDELAVDGVMLIGEHGLYPLNELGQKLYPRKELFDQIVAVYQRCGQTAPVFCDKHFSWNFDWAREMVQTARRMGFLFFGGSSLPHCPLTPPPPDLAQTPPEEVVGVYASGIESYGFHSMELVQSCVETRPGGETGVRSVTTYEGPGIAQAQRRGEWSEELFAAAVGTIGCKPENLTPDLAIVVDFIDGLRATHFNIFQQGFNGWSLALRRKGERTPHTARVVLRTDDAPRGNFARLARLIENAFATGEPPFPLERTLLATGMIAAAMRARAHNGVPLQTPELAIAYTPHHARTRLDAVP